MAHPKGDSAGGFDLHQRLSFLQQRDPVDRTFQGDILLPVQDVFIEGDAEISAVQGVERFPLVGQEHRGAQIPVIGAEILDFICDLRVHGKWRSYRKLAIAWVSVRVSLRLYTTDLYFFFSSTNTGSSGAAV